jgi:hypothetical protein
MKLILCLVNAVLIQLRGYQMTTPNPFNALIIFAYIVLLVSCSSQPVSDADKAKAAQTEVVTENMQKHLKKVPDWAVSPPEPDTKGIFASGIGESDNLSTAIKKARLEAEFGLAKLYSQELSGSERQYESDGDSISNRRFVGLIDKLVASVPVVGFSNVKQEVFADNGKYHAFVLLKLPYAEFNRVLDEKRAVETKREMKEAFDELESRLQSRAHSIGEATGSLERPVPASTGSTSNGLATLEDE